MNFRSDNQFSSARRNFVIASLILPFLLNIEITEDKFEEIKISPTKIDNDFIILGGWVLLYDDFIEKLG